MRTPNPAAQALLDRHHAGQQIGFVQLLELQLSTTLYLTTAGLPLPWAGQTWQPLGLALSPIEDDRDEFLGLQFELPAVTPEQLALVLVEDVEGAPVRVYDALVDPDTGQVAAAVLAWSGALEVPSIEDGPIARIVVAAEHRGALAIRPKPSRYTNDEQQRRHPGDTALNFDPGTDAAQIVWPAASFFRT